MPRTERCFVDIFDCMITLPLGVVRSIVTSMSVCLFVCLFVSLSVCPHNSKTAQPNFSNFCVCFLSPWLGPPVRALCTSGFVDDVVFHTMGPASGPKSNKTYVMFGRSSPGGATGWTSRQLLAYVVWSSSGGKIRHPRLFY